MKNVLHKVRLLPLMIIMLLSSSAYSSDGDWSVKIELSKQEFMLYEPIVLDVIATNNTSEPLETDGLYPANFSSLYIALTDSKWIQFKYTGPEYSITRTGPRRQMLPGEKDYGSFNLLDLFGAMGGSPGYDDRFGRGHFRFLPEGTYTVIVECEGDPANELTFDVIEPHGQEKEILRQIEKASQVWSQTDTGPSSEMFGEIVRDYPNSVYAEKCYYCSRVYADNMVELKRNSFDFRGVHKEMLSKYPNSAGARDWILSITRDMNENERLAFYDDLISKNPDTRASKVASILKKRTLADRERGE